ncbi:hypothetical protein GH733_008655 [Mirounga leonina]|nr:hypothetical protein GH733_008655 [Mirounga leonina]
MARRPERSLCGPGQRTVDDLEIIYEELIHIKALSHLSTTVKRELAGVLIFESHAKGGTGVVCTLHEGDDFGKLALVNDAPRAASIVLREDNCHFLRVDKEDFNRILRASQGTEQEKMDYALNNKRRVIRLVLQWTAVYGDALQEDDVAVAFLEEFYVSVSDDARMIAALKDQLPELEKIVKQISEDAKAPQKKHKVLLQQFNTGDERAQKRQPIRGSDEVLFKVYCMDHTYTTIRVPVAASVKEVISAVADKLGSGEGLIIVKMSSGGEKVVLKPNDVSVFTTLTINGRLFACPREQFDSLTPLPEQEGPTVGTVGTFELMSSKDLAYQMTIYDWELFNCVHELELIYHTFGRHNFKKTTANLDLFLRRFNEIQFWVVTEICLCSQPSKRVQLLKKFIKIAAHCKEYKNLNSFFAIVMGLSNVAVSRLALTWEKLPSKFKKFYAEFESLMDPSRNHRAYRLTVAKLEPPLIPFMPLLIKDMTFTHEGNKTFIDNLVNFEKMSATPAHAPPPEHHHCHLQLPPVAAAARVGLGEGDSSLQAEVVSRAGRLCGAGRRSPRRQPLPGTEVTGVARNTDACSWRQHRTDTANHCASPKLEIILSPLLSVVLCLPFIVLSRMQRCVILCMCLDRHLSHDVLWLRDVQYTASIMRITYGGRIKSVGAEIRRGNVGNMKNMVGKDLKGQEKEKQKLFRRRPEVQEQLLKGLRAGRQHGLRRKRLFWQLSACGREVRKV